MTSGLRLLALALLLGCSNLTEAEAGLVAVEITVPFPAEVNVGQTLQLAARALNRDGESAAVAITWATPDTTVAVDGATGLVTGIASGTGRVQAMSGSLTSVIVTITVVDPPVSP